MKNLMCVLLFLLVTTTSFAARQTGVVQGYVPYSDGDREILIFKITNNVSEGCNATGRFAIDNTSLRYKSTLSAIIAAFHSKEEISVEYLSSCNAWVNSADVNFICVGDINC